MEKVIYNNKADLIKSFAKNGGKYYEFSLNCYYDNDLAHIYFDDFKTEVDSQSLWFRGNYGYDYIVLFASEGHKNARHFKGLRKKSKRELFNLADDLGLVDSYGFDSITKKELLETLNCLTNEDYYKLHYEAVKWRELECDFVVRGYSQGEAIAINICYENCPYDSEYLRSLFYDSPLMLKIEISLNSETIEEFNAIADLEGFNEYDSYDKEKLIKMLSSHFAGKEYGTALAAWLPEAMPLNPEYIG